MKKFVIRSILFLIPFYIEAAIVILVDPYDYFTCHIIPERIKQKALREDKTTMVFNIALSKIIRYKRFRSKYVIIGASRSQLLDQEIISKYGGHDYFNFGVPGFGYPETYQTAACCLKLADVKEIIWGCGVHNFNDAWNKDRSIFDEAHSIMSKPLSFFFNKTLLYITS